MMWAVIMLLLLIAVIMCYWYLMNKVRLLFFKEKKKTKIQLIIPNIIIIAFILVLVLSMGSMNTSVIVIHLVLYWLVVDLISLIISKSSKKKISNKLTGILALLITFVYLAIGYYNCHHVDVTRYSLKTDKTSESLKVVVMSDVHLGTTFHADKLGDYIKDINKENPDLVLVPGDFIDDSTSFEDLINGCSMLGLLKTKYGVYFSYGNHDKGYGDAKSRGWTYEDLEAHFEKNGVVVLQDEIVDITDNFSILGRKDKSGERLDMSELSKKLDYNKYIIVMDHQPSDYNNEASANVDIVFSGHTHGGQLIPINRVGELIKVNDRTYGYEKRKNSEFIVTSGISCWALDFKTGCKSEYLVVEIN